MTMSFKQLIEEAAANKIPLSVTTCETDGKTLATFKPLGEVGRAFTAEIDHYAARVTEHSNYTKAKPPVSKPSALSKTNNAQGSATPVTKKIAANPKAKKAATAPAATVATKKK